MSHWNYRIVRDGESLVLAEVHYDDDSTPYGYTAEGCRFACIEAEEGRDGIVKSLERALKDAKEAPIIDAIEIGKDLVSGNSADAAAGESKVVNKFSVPPEGYAGYGILELLPKVDYESEELIFVATMPTTREAWLLPLSLYAAKDLQETLARAIIDLQNPPVQREASKC